MLFLKRSPRLRPVGLMLALAAGLFTNSAHAQVVESADGPGRALWVGGEYSNIHAGFPYQSSQRLWGIGAFVDYHLNSYLDVEAESRFLRFNSLYGESEDNYLAGPRYLVERFGRFQPFAQCLIGIGKMQYPFNIGSGQYLAVAPGGGMNYRISRRWTLRGEYEYQLWPGSPNFTNEPAHEITTNGIHVGLAFRIFRGCAPGRLLRRF
jgi:opacity protein-like surface antigen